MQVMRLGTALLRQRPSLLAVPEGRSLLENLLRLGLSAMDAQHRGLCEDVLDWSCAVITVAVRISRIPALPIVDVVKVPLLSKCVSR